MFATPPEPVSNPDEEWVERYAAWHNGEWRIPEPDHIVRQEWQRAVEEFSLKPGSPTEILVGRILDRLRGFSPTPTTENNGE